jgi:3',5'-cyclic-AMP phosphodiesterase
MTYAVNVIYGHNIGDDSHTLLLVRLGSPDSFVKDTFTMFNVASVSGVWPASSETSQGLIVDVRDGVVRVQGRDFLKHEWPPEAEYQINISK